MNSTSDHNNISTNCSVASDKSSENYEATTAEYPTLCKQLHLSVDQSLPRLKVSSFQSHFTNQGTRHTHHTSGLSSQYPLIKELRGKRRQRSGQTLPSSYLLTNYHTKYINYSKDVKILQNSSNEFQKVRSTTHVMEQLKQKLKDTISDREMDDREVKIVSGYEVKKMTSTKHAESLTQTKSTQTKSSTDTFSITPSSLASLTAEEEEEESLHTLTISRNSNKSFVEYKDTRKNVSSLQSLPQIQASHSKPLTGILSTGNTSNHSINDRRRSLLNRSSELDINSLQEMLKKKHGRGRRDGRCSVSNLRIPFGKVEKWDVPQPTEVRMEQRNVDDQLQNSDPGEEEGVLCKTMRGGNDSGVDNTTFKNTSNLCRLEFIVFSDQQLPSTSTLVASLIHQKPHTLSTHRHLTHTAHHHSTQTSPHTHSHIDHTHNDRSTATDDYNTTNTAIYQVNTDSIMHFNTTQHSHNTDLITHAYHPTNTDHNLPNKLSTCITLATDSVTSLCDPNLNETSFEYSTPRLPHTLRYYHHQNSRERRVSIPCHLLNHGLKTECNHSMSITSYPTRSGHQRHSKKSSSTNEQTMIDSQRAGTTPSLTKTDDVTTINRDTALHQTPFTIKQFRNGQVVGQRTRGSSTVAKTSSLSTVVVEEDKNYCSRGHTKKKHSDINDFSYPDPLWECSSRYYHRLVRLTALVSDTLTYEHNKKRYKTT